MPEPKERVKQDSSCRLFSGLERAAELVPRYCEISQVAIQVEDSSSARAVFDGGKERKRGRKATGSSKTEKAHNPTLVVVYKRGSEACMF